MAGPEIRREAAARRATGSGLGAGNVPDRPAERRRPARPFCLYADDLRLWGRSSAPSVGCADCSPPPPTPNPETSRPLSF